MTWTQTAICSRCKVEKVIDDFPRDKTRKRTGRYPQCKACRREKYFLNPEPERHKQREYSARNKAKLNKAAKVYAARRFFHTRANNIKVRSDCTVSATHFELARLWRKQRGICPFTGRRLTRDNSQIDHIVPKRLGGADTIENLRWVHRDVNYAKRDLPDSDFLRLCIEIVTTMQKTI